MIIIRIILVITLGFIIGIIFGLCFEKSIALFLLFILLIYCVIRKNIKEKSIKGIVFLLIISSFIGNSYLIILNNFYEEVYKKDGIKIENNAVIVSNLEETENSYSYTIKIKDGELKNKKLIIYTKKHYKNKLEYGDLIKICGEYQKPQERRNYKGFDYSKYLKQKNIYGIIKVQNLNFLEKNKTNLIFSMANKLKNNLENKIKDNLNFDEANLLISIILGDKQNLSEEIKENFTNSGLAHVLAVSGMHVSYLILAITYFFSNNSKKLKQIITIIVLLIFLFITGFTPSVVRSIIMAIYLIIAKTIYQKEDIFTSISISILTILIVNPFQILNVGLQLSYLGTIGIIFFNKEIVNKIKLLLERRGFNFELYKLDKTKNVILNLLIKCVELISVSVSAQILVLPIIILNYNTICLNFLISSIFISPIIGVTLIFSFIILFISYIFKFKFIWLIPEILLDSIIFFTSQISKIPFSNYIVKTPKAINIVLYYLIIFTIFILYKKRIKINFKKVLIVLLLVIVIANINFSDLIFKSLRVYFIDVGQGDSTLIITPKNKKIVIDGGEDGTLVFNYLLDRRITKIDYLIISHFDEDHCNGLMKVLEKIKVKKVVIGNQYEQNENLEMFKDIVNKQKIDVKVVNNKTKINVEEGFYFEVLWPSKDEIIQENLINNNALVLKMTYENESVLFTGDIEKQAEESLVNEYKNTNKLKSTILKVAHHGSKTSSSEEFLKLVNPKISLIGVGKNNKFGHPNNEVIQRLEKLNCKIYRTDEDAEIEIKINKNGKIKVKKRN